MKKYILDKDNNPIEEPDLRVWAKWIEENPLNKIVCRTFLPGPEKIWVSTVFLGIDHRFDNSGEPILWETMIFGGEHDSWQDRYSSHEDAVIGHLKALDMARNAQL